MSGVLSYRLYMEYVKNKKKEKIKYPPKNVFKLKNVKKRNITIPCKNCIYVI